MFCFGGGIGIRGLGEIKLEIDCWYIWNKIFVVKKELKEVEVYWECNC